MGSNKEKIYELLSEIEALIKNNETEDGTFRFDEVRAMVALDFARTEIQKTIVKPEWRQFLRKDWLLRNNLL